MYNKNNKLYFDAGDFETSVKDVINLIQSETKKVHIITLFRGGLPLGTRLSNELNLPLSILDYQRLDGDSKIVKFIKDSNIKKDEIIYLVDDIADEGSTVSKALEFLKDICTNKIQVYTIFGNNQKHNSSWKYSFKHSGDWIVFGPWEGYND